MTPQAPALHPLGVGELLDSAIYVYRKNFVTLVGIAAVFALSFPLLQFAAAFFVPGFPFFWDIFWPMPGYMLGGQFALYSLPIVYLEAAVVRAVFGPVAIVIEVGAFAYATSEWRLGHRVTILSAYRRALRCWPSLFGSAILVELSIVLASALLVAPLFAVADTPLFYASLVGFIPALVCLVIFVARWSLTTPAIMLEDLGALKGMGRSWRLLKESFWRAWAVLLAGGLLVNVGTYAIFVAAQFFALRLTVFVLLEFADSLLVLWVVTAAGGVIAGAMIQPFAYVVVTLLYYDLRVRHEGYDLQLSLEQLKQSATAVAAEGRA